MKVGSQYDLIDDGVENTQVMPFPAIRMVGRHREVARMIADLPDEERVAIFTEQCMLFRMHLRTIGVAYHLVADQGCDFAYALAMELKRLGVRGPFEGWLKNWTPKGSPDHRRRA